MSPAASLFVTIVTLANIFGVVWLLWWARRRRGETAETAAETTGHVWDEDLRELNNPLPRWWLGLFLLTVVFGLVYLLLYPGLGNFPGLKGWTQIEQHRRQTERAEAVLAKTFAPFEGRSVVELASDADALRIGRNLFLNNCATCHGSDARGAPGFPNLTDADWLWGGAPETIYESIANGRTGVMMPWREVLGDAGVEDMVAYVLSLSGRKLPAGDVARGKQKFAEICAACHGPDARGNPLVGAPNLTDNTWLHGGSVAAVRETIANGRQGQMPAHLDLLGEARVKLLAAYVLSLSRNTPDRSRTAALSVVTPPGSDRAGARSGGAEH